MTSRQRFLDTQQQSSGVHGIWEVQLGVLAAFHLLKEATAPSLNRFSEKTAEFELLNKESLGKLMAERVEPTSKNDTLFKYTENSVSNVNLLQRQPKQICLPCLYSLKEFYPAYKAKVCLALLTSCGLLHAVKHMTRSCHGVLPAYPVSLARTS